MFNHRRVVIARDCHSATFSRRVQSSRLRRCNVVVRLSLISRDVCVGASVCALVCARIPEKVCSLDDGNGTVAAAAAAAAAAVADVAIPSASCYFLQRFSVFLTRRSAPSPEAYQERRALLCRFRLIVTSIRAETAADITGNAYCPPFFIAMIAAEQD